MDFGRIKRVCHGISKPVDMLCSTVSAPFFLFVGHSVGHTAFNLACGCRFISLETRSTERIPPVSLSKRKQPVDLRLKIVAVIDNFLVTVPLFNSLSLPFTVLCAITKGADAMAKR